MTVYLDVVLIENLIMNYIILFTTGYILKLKIKHLRLIISSLLGGIYAILSYINILEIYSSVFMKIILSIAMIYISFKPKNVKNLVKEIMIFYLTSFAFGGTAFGLLYLIKPQDIFIRNGVLYGTYPIKIALMGAVVGFTIMVISFKLVKNKISKNDMYCKIKITNNEKEKRINAMLDTGNMLKDPITRIPVIVVEKDVLYDLIPTKILDNLEKIIGGDLENEFYEEKTCLEFISKFRVIPFCSLGKQNGMLIGIKADNVVVFLDDNEEVINDVIIGISNQKLSKKDKYNALLGLEVFKKEEKNEYIKSTSK